MTAFRRPGAASAAVLIALSASLAGAQALAPKWTRDAGLDVWNLAELERARQTAAEERAEIEAFGERAERRRATARQIAAQLAAGTVGLPEAADGLFEVFRHDPGMRDTLAATYRAEPSERHRFARHAIDRVHTMLYDDPARLAAVLPRLEEEYRTMCARPEARPSPSDILGP